jgi:hypothetical protein
LAARAHVIFDYFGFGKDFMAIGIRTAISMYFVVFAFVNWFHDSEALLFKL